jgi:hypothetical protein
MGSGGIPMMTHPTLQYMVSQVDQRERQSVAAAARRVPQSQPGLLARLVAGVRERWQPVSPPAVGANPSGAIGRISEAGA